MMKVEWSAAAVADVDRFAHFLQDRFPEMAKVVGRELLQQSDLLIEPPQLGARWPLALTFANSSCAFSTHFT